MTGVARALADRVVGVTAQTVPADVLDKGRRALLHNLSVSAVGGALAPVARRWAEGKGAGDSRAWLTGRSLSPADAAFANGCLAHARAQDDVYFPGLTHVGATTIPAVLALAEQLDASVDEVVLAIVAGYETAGAVSTPAAGATTGYGFRATGIYGVFGAAAGCAKLLGLDAEQTANAIAIAASFAAGTNQTWVDGSLEWQFEVGQAARSGLEAAMIAQAGGTGAPSAFEGVSGFFAAFARDAGLASSMGEPGSTWFTRAVTFKPYPVCAILQAPVTAAIALLPEVADRELVSGTLRLTPGEAHYPGTEGRAPFDDPGAALMSASYCLAIALTEGTVLAEDLFRSDEEGLKALSHRIDVIADESLGRQSFVLDLDFGDGVTRHVEHIGDGTTFNWERADLELNVERLKVEAPAGIDLDALIAACFSGGTSAKALIDTIVAA